MRGIAPLEMFPLCRSFRIFCSDADARTFPPLDLGRIRLVLCRQHFFADRGGHWVALDAGLVVRPVVQRTIENCRTLQFAGGSEVRVHRALLEGDGRRRICKAVGCCGGP